MISQNKRPFCRSNYPPAHVEGKRLTEPKLRDGEHNLLVNTAAAKQAEEIHGRQLDNKRHSSEVIYSSSDQNDSDSKVTAGEEDRKRDTEPKRGGPASVSALHRRPEWGSEWGRPAQHLQQKNFNNPGNKSCVGVGNNGKLSCFLSGQCAFSLHNSHLQGEGGDCCFDLHINPRGIQDISQDANFNLMLFCFTIHFICSAPPKHNKSAARKKEKKKL